MLNPTHDELAKEHIRHMVGGHSALSQEEKAFAKFLQALGYPYAEETGNPVYRMFLRG